jgi:imidazolonepropionase-like amidohydrolase
VKRLLPFVLTSALLPGQEILLRNATIHPVSGPEITGSLLIKGGVIADSAPKINPAKGARVLDLKGLHVYPGMIDSATTLGLNEIDSIRETQDSQELGDFNPQLRSIIAVNASSELIPVARANGITSAVTLPGGGVIAGQAGLMHLDGWTWEEMSIQPSLAMHLRFPVLTTNPPVEFFQQPRRIPYAEARKNYEEMLRKLRLFFEDARRYQKAKATPASGLQPDRKLEAMLPVLEGKLPVIVTAAREREIREALDFAEKEKIRLILAGPRSFGAQLERVKAANMPVLLGKTLSLPLDEDDPYDAQFTLPAELHRNGILFAFATFDSADVRNLPYQAAAAVPFGLPRAEALKAVTINAARIWRVDDKLGSIEKGKLADIIVTDGDPLETRTQIKHIFIRGREVDLQTKHTRLYEKYLNRP